MWRCRPVDGFPQLSFALLLVVVVAAAVNGTAGAAGEIRIFRPDGTMQCGKDGVARDGRSLDEDRALLEKLGAKVSGGEKRKMPGNVITVCGVVTGRVNTFVISPTEWQKLKRSFVGPAGFSIWPYDSPTVIVFQYDGSRQCEGDSGISLEDMGKALTQADIRIVSSKRANDGLFHPLVCGYSTGIINTYEIASTDLGEAMNLGFSYLSTPDMAVGMKPAAVMNSDGAVDGKVPPSPWPFPW